MKENESACDIVNPFNVNISVLFQCYWQTMCWCVWNLAILHTTAWWLRDQTHVTLLETCWDEEGMPLAHHSHLMVWKEDLALFSKLSPSFKTCSSLSSTALQLPFMTVNRLLPPHSYIYSPPGCLRCGFAR